MHTVNVYTVVFGSSILMAPWQYVLQNLQVPFNFAIAFIALPLSTFLVLAYLVGLAEYQQAGIQLVLLKC